MTTHKINDREYIFLEVPEGATGFELSTHIEPMDDNFKSNKYSAVYFDHKDSVYDHVKIPMDDYTILGLASGLTEEQAHNLVDYEIRIGVGVYPNYEVVNKPFTLTSAKVSLFQLIISKGLNPERTLIIERKK